ncbi:unnamed protein product, partial [Allacma fusca]
CKAGLINCFLPNEGSDDSYSPTSSSYKPICRGADQGSIFRKKIAAILFLSRDLVHQVNELRKLHFILGRCFVGCGGQDQYSGSVHKSIIQDSGFKTWSIGSSSSTGKTLSSDPRHPPREV